MNYPRLEAFKARIRARYPDKADFSEIDKVDCTIKEAYESGARMCFNYSPTGEPEDFPARGYVGVSTGWTPTFLLINNARSLGGDPLPRDCRAMGYSNPRRPKYKVRKE